MALVLADRVKETCTSPGVGAVTLLGAVTGFQSFAVIGNGNTTYYAIADQTGANWETGVGTYSTTGPTLTRTTVIASSNANTTVNFASGTQDVFCTYISSRAISTDILASPPAIGGTTPAAITGTTITANTAFSGPHNGTVGATTPNTGAFTTLSATGVITSTLATGTSPFSITSTTVVPNLNVSQLLGNTWAIPGTIGSTTPNSGAFTTLSASSTVSGTGFSNYLASPPAIGGTAAAAGSFTSLTATSVGTAGVLAKTGGLTAVTAVAGSLTLATGGVTLASQVMATGSVWRIRAYGTYAAASSVNARTLTMSCFWGATALTAVTTGNVLASIAQTTPWQVELEISGSSATAAWCTAVLVSQVTSATIPQQNISTAASVTALTTTSTLDFRVGQTGTATATDTINVHSVTIERIK